MEYPWPSGKASWLQENGESGIVPPLALSSPARGDWRRLNLRPPASRQEALKMLELSERLVELGLEGQGIDVNTRHVLFSSVRLRLIGGKE